MTGLFQVDGKTFRSHQEAGRYIRSLTPAHRRSIQAKTINKLILNSTYGYLPGSLSQKLGRYRELSRQNDERNATIWRRLFGSKSTPKPKFVYSPIPGGASLNYPSSRVITLHGEHTAEEITKTGRQTLKDLLAKMGTLDV